MSMPPSARDHRIDWLRGLALASIFINHMPGNRFENWTTRNFGFSDAAEVFVLLAGVAAAFAFFRSFESGGQEAALRKAARRASLLYAAHIGSTFAAIALFAAAAYTSANPDFLDLIGIAPLISEPLPGVIGILTGGYQLGYFNILPLYVVLLAALPGLLWIAVRDVRLMLAASLAVYLAAHLLPVEMPNYPTGGGWYFNPFAWQLIFAIGLALGIMRLRGRSVPYHAIAFDAALAYIAFSAAWMIGSLGGHITYGLLPEWIDTLHKSNLPASRLVHVLALAYVLVHLPLWAWMMRIPVADPLTRMGRNSLPVFVTGSLASMAGYIVLVQTGGGLLLETGLIAAGLGAMHGVALLCERPAAQPVAVAIREPLAVRETTTTVGR